ncbi:MAG: pyridoxamine 5'-phosphate oxidase family protein [Nitrospiraceae bacterium]|jgi:predicted pyridoxine 5'-phosphate oxidase superfamily flavin-nucleotide-binding protein|uniref:pyridoxamine 5'-phosphate oxidase family protein n=1 Tax=Nitrospira cf. moscoviensis SBR1015 TaxID=96242 RepID=UPI000A0D9B20|nr:pyridoxamine 5'-phosphate oxidase family protein [Nitrospira cf. moscoviensis SBR1015]MBY0247925.1 pyridoxamine 5'-phosphate oxidase family protein [Nitrospiraceae bacterium]OQW37119.1 MAG: pyridoxamine 5'-phosphate oxidase [Nitrospira sp. SG-bin2]
MALKYLELAMTEAVRRAQSHYYGTAVNIAGAPECDPLTHDEAEFIAARDSFYLGSISETGWPYIQHRGGPKGFLRVVNETTLAFADYKGNRQLLTTGNVSMNDRVALFLMDYQNRARLKILGHARVEDARTHPELIAQLADPKMRASVERLVFIDVVSFDWNCPKYITPRYSIEEVEELTGSLRTRISQLEAELRAARRGSSTPSAQ